MMATAVVVDTSVLVGSIDARDVHHATASALITALADRDVEAILLDCVVVETIGVLCRRRAERRVKSDLPELRGAFAAERVTRAYPLLEHAWAAILAEVQRSSGKLNAHDALILEWARREAPFVATLDGGLRGPGVTVFASAADVARALDV
ncbi:MAG: PIN domain-containing protein [Myxococcales bacterium]|nr:PIN domain-containing protein [Myxococcales bacterium]